MLHLMRKHAGSLLIKVALGIIVVVFVFWGLGSYRERKGNRVAVVDGAVITMDEYRTVYERLLDRYRSQFGGALNDEILKSLNVKKQALEDLISRQLLLQEAARRKLQVTNEDLARAIQNIGAFQSAGRFDPELYRRLLAANRMTPEMFEETLRMDLLVENLQNIVLTGVKVSDQEAYEAYRWREAQADVDYVVFAPTSFKDVEANDKEIETYFSEHKQTYETPPQVKTA
jgi:peptidyl-prolyl cis-trans isomerase D